MGEIPSALPQGSVGSVDDEVVVTHSGAADGDSTIRSSAHHHILQNEGLQGAVKMVADESLTFQGPE